MARINAVIEYIDISHEAVDASVSRLVYRASKIDGILYILMQSKIPNSRMLKLSRIIDVLVLSFVLANIAGYDIKYIEILEYIFETPAGIMQKSKKSL